MRSNSIADVDCNTGTPDTPQHRSACGSGYFMQEVINDGTNSYYHVIIGDIENDTFAQEFYIRTAGCCWFNEGPRVGPSRRLLWEEAPLTASHGDGRRLANMWWPLGQASLSATATGNPSRVYMRQELNDGEIDQQFLKAREATKPRISQVIADDGIESNFIADLSNGDYTGFSDPRQFENTLVVYDNGQRFGAGDFDMKSMVQHSSVTAGDYYYVDGGSHGNSFGDYVYNEAKFDIYTRDWQNYCIDVQNPDRQCDLGGGFGPPPSRTGSITLRDGQLIPSQPLTMGPGGRGPG